MWRTDEALELPVHTKVLPWRSPIRIGVLCSHRAPGLAYMLDEDPGRGRLYEIACCLTSEETFAEHGLVSAHGIPAIAHSIRRFCQERARRVMDRRARAEYDAVTFDRLAPFRLDLIVLAGYLYVLTEPMLSPFRHRIINVHHSDLTVRDAAGRARFPGLRAVRDSILAGEAETRATVHVVTSELDQGPPLLRSWPFPVSPLARDAIVSGTTDVLKAYVFAHQEWMIRSTWGPLLAATIESIACGRVNLAAPPCCCATLAEPPAPGARAPARAMERC
jgi:folate-dependent phosphoribosylglycinamide formyltransferase PurN